MNKILLLACLFGWYVLFNQIPYLELCPAAEAKIGDPISSFQAKFSRIFTLKDSSSKDGKTYYRFTLIKDPIQQKKAPGFAGGMTVTCTNGKIQGESLVVRLGRNLQIGKVFTTGLSLDLTYEAIGKPIITDQKGAVAEYLSYLNAINQALLGDPQDIKYAGYNTRITLSRTGAGDILLAIMPNPPAAHADKGKKTK